MRFGKKFTAAIAICGISAAAHSSTIWDESINGDLSNDGLNPTSLIATLGSNIMLGVTGGPGAPDFDRDYFKFTVPDGAVLSAIVVLGNTLPAGGVSFIGIQPGPQLTVSPTGAGASAMIAFGHYGTANIGNNLFPTLLVNAAATGGVLPSGTYSFWVQDTGGSAPFGFDFQITPVPLPGAALLLFSGLGGLAAFRRKRKSA